MHVHTGILSLRPSQVFLAHPVPLLANLEWNNFDVKGGQTDLDKTLGTLTGRPNTLIVDTRAIRGTVAVVEALDALLVRVPVGEASVAGAQERTPITVPTRGVRSTRIT